ncbi:MAG: helix-turn-helix transcriptional regulator [Clostridiales bacterium]|nr:helix-turn-helix transcriptional regulator [Clostridiales bacterium]
MNINDILKQKNLTKYRLSKISGVPYATVSDISSGKAKIEKCSADTLYKLAKGLDVTIEDLIEDSMEHRQSFEAYKSTVCHQVRHKGDIDFIVDTLKSNDIRKLYQKKWYPESLYLLAMVDYLSHENGLPVCVEYDDLRASRLHEPIFPASVIAMSTFSRSERPKHESYAQSIPEFRRFNIIESEVRNVF